MLNSSVSTTDNSDLPRNILMSTVSDFTQEETHKITQLMKSLVANGRSKAKAELFRSFNSLLLKCLEHQDDPPMEPKNCLDQFLPIKRLSNQLSQRDLSNSIRQVLDLQTPKIKNKTQDSISKDDYSQQQKCQIQHKLGNQEKQARNWESRKTDQSQHTEINYLEKKSQEELKKKQKQKQVHNLLRGNTRHANHPIDPPLYLGSEKEKSQDQTEGNVLVLKSLASLTSILTSPTKPHESVQKQRKIMHGK